MSTNCRECGRSSSPDTQRCICGHELCDTADLVLGQRLLNAALLLQVVVWVIQAETPAVATQLAVATLGLLMSGAWILGRGFRWSTTDTVLILILLLIPGVSLLVVLRVSWDATEALLRAGYKVGFFGASR